MVSIALATYNGEKYLKEQLDSIYSQTFKDIELVVSDDNSKDSTVDILKEYKKSHGLKLSINNENLGFVKNFEKAISGCTGDYIALSDQDDIWYPEKIETLHKEIGKYSLICSDAELIDMDGNVTHESLQKFSKSYVNIDDQFRFFVFRNYVTGCTAMLSRELVTKATPIPGGIRYHDWWYATIAATLKGVKFLDQPLIKYRQHSENDTGANRSANLFRKSIEFKEKKSGNVFQEEIDNINGMLNFAEFNEIQKNIIKDRLTFYANIQNSLIHLKSFKVAFKYRNYMLAGKNIIYKIVFLLSTLFR